MAGVHNLGSMFTYMNNCRKVQEGIGAERGCLRVSFVQRPEVNDPLRHRVFSDFLEELRPIVQLTATKLEVIGLVSRVL